MKTIATPASARSPPARPPQRKRSIPRAAAMKNVISGTSATNVAAIADGAWSRPQYARAYAMPKFRTPRTATPGNEAPSGSRIPRHVANATRIAPATAKRSPAPQKGASSRLLKRTATKFVPPISTTIANTTRTALDGRLILATIRDSGPSLSLADGRTSRRDGRAARGHEALRRHRRGRPPEPRRPRGPHHRPHRAVRMRQDHVAAHGEPAHRADLGRDPHRWPERDARGSDAPPEADRLRHPAGWPLSASDDRGERRDRPEAPRLAGGTHSR